MTKSIRKIALAAVLTLGTALSASAATLIIDSSPQKDASNDAHIYADGYGANTPIGAAWDTDPTFGPGNADGVAQSPFNFTPELENWDYFSVGGGEVLGPVNLTFDTMQTAINVLWGSIDSYNTISFFNGVSEIFSMTGTELVALGSLGGVAANFEQVALVNFSFENGFDRVQFASSRAAFEFALAPVPLPAGGLLLLTALGGLVVARRRKA